MESADDTVAATLGPGVTRPTAPKAMLARGATIGRYVVLDKLGAGGMGVVYAAYDPELDRKIALKMLLGAEDGSQATHGRARLLREAQALAKFSHPEIVAIHDVGEHQAGVWIAMEFVDGRTLSQWAREANPNWLEVLVVMQAAGRGVAAAHGQGIVHRDLKPDNIMIGSDGRVRVMDFGLTRVAHEQEIAAAGDSLVRRSDDEHGTGPLTRHGSLLGTPGYMAPEQWSGDEVGEAADQFSLAVTMWELLYRERPFVAPTMMELAALVIAGGRPVPPKSRRIPSWLRRTLERALAPDPTKRWPSVAAWLDQLARGRARHRRRRIGIGVLAVVLVGAGLRAESWRQERRINAGCENDAAEIQVIWNDDARTRVRTAMTATGLSFAPATSERVVALLDQRANDWHATRLATCLDAAIEGEAARPQAPELGGQTSAETDLERAAWCFDERAMELGALIEELEVADALIVQKAVNALVALPRVEACADAEQLRRRPDPPTSEIRPAVSDLHRKIARAATLKAAGQYESALSLANSALADAEASGYLPLISASRAQVGSILDAKGESIKADEVLTRAYFEALDAAWPEQAAETAAALWVLGAVRLSSPTADLWGRLAESGMRAAGIPDGDVRRLRLALDRGSVLWIRGQRQAAVDNNSQAIAAIEALLGPHHPDLARGLNVIGNALHKLDRPDEAYDAFKRALEIREHAYGPDHPEVASSASNLANALASMERYAESAEIFEQAIEVAVRALGEKHPLTATSINNSFFPLQGLGRLQDAEDRLVRALALRTELLGPTDAWTSYTRGHLVEVQREALDYQGLRRTYEDWLAVSRVHGATPGGLAGLELGVIEADLAQGRLEGLEERLDRCAALIESERKPGDPPELGTVTLRARLALAQSKPAEARAIAERSLAARAGIGTLAVAEGQFELAKVLIQFPAERRRAISLAEQARDGFRSARADGRAGRLGAEAWLREHGP